MVAEVATRERPIIFSAAMVKALLSGAKTQTRRVMKDQPPHDDFDVGFYHPTFLDRRGEEFPGDEVFGAFSRDGEWGIKSPFAPGMKLWVQETFDYGVEGKRPVHGVIYCADGEFQYREQAKEKWPSDGKLKPSVHMAKWASRITLEITDVRVERLSELSEEDARAEGIKQEDLHPGGFDPDNFHPPGAYGFVSGLHLFPKGRIYPKPQEAFRELWDSINAKRKGGKYSWEKSPWVWAITFKRVDDGR